MFDMTMYSHMIIAHIKADSIRLEDTSTHTHQIHTQTLTDGQGSVGLFLT